MSTLVVIVMLIISSVLDCGTASKVSLSPALKPTSAGTLSEELIESPVFGRKRLQLNQNNFRSNQCSEVFITDTLESPRGISSGPLNLSIQEDGKRYCSIRC